MTFNLQHKPRAERTSSRTHTQQLKTTRNKSKMNARSLTTNRRITSLMVMMKKTILKRMTLSLLKELKCTF